jgi:hypothetical protein
MINYLKAYYLNDKGLHDFEKRMIISKLLGGGGGGCSLQLPWLLWPWVVFKSDKTGQLGFNSQFATAHDCMNNAIK